MHFLGICHRVDGVLKQCHHELISEALSCRKERDYRLSHGVWELMGVKSSLWAG